ncbi:TIGR04283 family arsenosugar biosynthesis glycosyltransferase [Formosa algae]|uniref:RSAM/selenodomain-associated transferase 2 n=1 Tax=Formosa algae TaxID=225843 RepID=A0A9X0YIN7_9FLAO|nr:TIGR04283 family arsenosugar biosynthesis glycosyltransferase [Formosa algae]MBP1839214.1 rSAM/selenodomain-associated transferase 2 [Formosa algae]MDQ0333991.1 rSAM/selenodomain-associated transferase 2 [Formosa algae]OEI79720.1 glycosyl transferase family 2 [Formosa algae]
MHSISILIPVLNEAENLQELIPYLLKNSSTQNIKDIIIVDGGSTDGTKNIIQHFSQVKLVQSEKGRAKQMNFGAKIAKGDILYFLHADSFPPKDFDKDILERINTKTQAGCFKMSFNSSHWWLKLAGWLTRFSWKISRGGDQSLFITKSLFNALNGYNESYIIYEDNHLIHRIYNASNFAVIQKNITTSARRYQTNGIWNLQYHFMVIHLKYRLGHPPNLLYNYYLKHIYVKK